MFFSDFSDYHKEQGEVKKRYKFKRKKELKIKELDNYIILKNVNLNLMKMFHVGGGMDPYHIGGIPI